MSAPAHIAPVSMSVRYVVIPQDGGYVAYRSTRHDDGKWYRDLSDSAGFSHGLGTAINLANDAAKYARGDDDRDNDDEPDFSEPLDDGMEDTPAYHPYQPRVRERMLSQRVQMSRRANRI